MAYFFFFFLLSLQLVLDGMRVWSIGRSGLSLTARLFEFGIHLLGKLCSLVIIILPLLDLASSAVQLGLLCQRVVTLNHAHLTIERENVSTTTMYG